MITPLIKDSYLSVIQNSLGTNMFKNFYALVDGEKKDIVDNGNISCAYYASTILVMFNLIKRTHVTVLSTVKDMEDSGWTQTELSKAKLGDVLVWEAVDFGKNGTHKHIGFFVGESKAISNNSKLGIPSVHDINFDEERKIEKILTNKILD